MTDGLRALTLARAVLALGSIGTGALGVATSRPIFIAIGWVLGLLLAALGVASELRGRRRPAAEEEPGREPEASSRRAHIDIEPSPVLDPLLAKPTGSPIAPARGTRLRAELTRSGLYARDDAGAEAEGDSSPSGVFTTADMVNRLHPSSLCWLQSSSAEQLFLGWSLDQLRQKSFPDIVHPDQRERAVRELLGAVSKGEAHGLIYHIRTARGRWRAIEMNVGVRYGLDQRPSHLRCHISDVTDKLKAVRGLKRRTRQLAETNDLLCRINTELQELKDRYSDLYQNAPVMYFSLGADGTIQQCNDTMVRTLGYAREQLQGRSYASLVAPGERGALPRDAQLLKNVRSELESRWARADGTTLDVGIVATAVRDADGVVTGARIVAQDVTARKALEAELRAKHQELTATVTELSRRNKELDEFTYVVSHDLQEPVRSLISFSDLLLSDCEAQLTPEGRESLHFIVDGARRMRALIHDLLVLSRAGRSVGEFSLVELPPMLDRIRRDLTELLRSRKAEIRLIEPVEPVWGDRDRIAQLVTNLICNGIKYNVRENPLIEIGVGSSDNPALLSLFVRDNGIGIDPRFHDKVFQIFRRLHTREEYEGTGAGLAICQKIVQAHGGRIWLESQLDQGTTVHFTLPRPPSETATTTDFPIHGP